jgi:hypothetical protein
MASGEMSEEEFRNFLRQVCTLMAGHSTPASLHYLCIDWRHIADLLAAGREVYNELTNLCVWVKNNAGMSSLYRSQYELICVFKRGRRSHRNNVLLGKYGRNRTNVWNYPCASSFSRSADEGNLLALHPTVKPAALVGDAIMDCTDRGDFGDGDLFVERLLEQRSEASGCAGTAGGITRATFLKLAVQRRIAPS